MRSLSSTPAFSPLDDKARIDRNFEWFTNLYRRVLHVMLDNWKLERAHKRFFKGNTGEIVDVFGRLDPK